MNDSLDDIRKDIDAIDDEILALLSKRAQKSLEVKKTNGGGAPLRRDREATIVKRMVAANQGPFDDVAVQNIFESIVYNGRNLQGELKVSYLGPEGTYSEQASRSMFGESAVYVAKRTPRQVIDAVLADESNVAVLPIENSTEGAVVGNHKLLHDIELPIIAEYTLSVHHALVGKTTKLADIKTVYGHPQALGQCREWLETYLPNAELVECASNARGLELVRSAHEAAIASERGATQHDLNIIETNINDNPDNKTRFVAFARDEVAATGDDKTSIFCTVHEKSGALHDLLGVLSSRGITMTRLQSQPFRGNYGFFIDFVGHKDDPEIAAALNELEAKALSFKLLGSYPRES